MKTLLESPLFKGFTEEETKEMICWTGAIKRHFEKGESVYLAGDCVEKIGIVLSGKLLIMRELSGLKTSHSPCI